MRRIPKKIFFFVLLVLCVELPARALGLGDIRVQSALGQPLKAQLSLVGADLDVLATRCINAKVETADGSLLANLIVTIFRVGQNNFMSLSARQSINEPAVRIVVDAHCETQLHRDYMILLDPPQYAPTPPRTELVPVVKESLAVASTAMKTQKLVDVRNFSRSNSSGGKEEKAVLPSIKTPSPAIRRKSKLRRAASPVRDVLRLSDDSFVEPRGLKLSEHLSPMGERQLLENLVELRAAQNRMAALLRGEDSDQVRKIEQSNDQKKIQTLQIEAAQLRKQSQINQTLLEETRTTSYSRNWVIVLGALVLFCIAIVVLLLLQIRRMQKVTKSSWWEQGREKKEAERRKSIEDMVDDVQASYEPVTKAAGTISGKNSGWDVNGAEEHGNSTFDKSTTDDIEQIFQKSTTKNRTPTLEESNSSTFNYFSPRGSSVKVEEISDVTQEAEFWMSVNDPQRAIEILDSQANNTHPDSPVPWLYLLDLYRLVNDKEKYDELRDRFILFFNANIPDFDVTSRLGGLHQLEDFPHLVERICALWNSNAIIPFLQSLLIGTRDGKRVGFELSVYRDILMLISLARELEHFNAIEGADSRAQPGPNETPSFSSDPIVPMDMPDSGLIEFDRIDFPDAKPRQK